MRILHITSHLNIGGITRSVLTLAKEGAKRGHEVTIASSGGSLGKEAFQADVRLFAVPLNTSAEFGFSAWKSYWMLEKFMKENAFDILHGHTRVGQVIAHRLAKRFGLPWVATWHGFYRQNIGRKLWPCTGDATIAISGPVQKHLVDDFSVEPERVMLIPHGIDIDFFRTQISLEKRHAILDNLEFPRDSQIIGTVSRLVPIKGIDHLIRAMDKLRDKLPHACLVIAGDGPHRLELEQLVRDEGLTKNVRFVGAMAETAELLALMDVFVFMPSTQEGFGLTLLEAMASGCPVVAIKRGVGAEWVLDQTRPIQTVPPEDPVDLMQAIYDMLKDREKAKKLSEEACQWVRDYSSSERMMDTVENLYQKLIDNNAEHARHSS